MGVIAFLCVKRSNVARKSRLWGDDDRDDRLREMLIFVSDRDKLDRQQQSPYPTVNVYGVDPGQINRKELASNRFVFQMIVVRPNLGALLNSLINGDDPPRYMYLKWLPGSETTAGAAEVAAPRALGDTDPTGGGILDSVPVSQDEPPTHGPDMVAIYSFSARFIDIKR